MSFEVLYKDSKTNVHVCVCVCDVDGIGQLTAFPSSHSWLAANDIIILFSPFHLLCLQFLYFSPSSFWLQLFLKQTYSFCCT